MIQLDHDLKQARQNLSVVDHNAIELSPRISEADVADYVALLKPRVMSLVIFTALVGLVIAPGYFHPVLAFTSLLCIAVGAGPSGALNMALEGDIDALMSRTANRPIPRGRVTRGEALAFGMTLAFFAVMTLGILVNWVARALLAFTIFFDSVYGVISLILGAVMLALAADVYRRREGRKALRATRKLFAFSIFYLFGLFATLLIEVVVRAIAPSIW